MTIRILEDGDYRVQENGCIRDLQQTARVLENQGLRTYEDATTRTLQDAVRQAQQLQSCCGDRRLEIGGRRLLEYQTNCKLAVCGSNVVSYMIGTNVAITWGAALCCGNHHGSANCVPYYTYEIVEQFSLWPWATGTSIVYTYPNCVPFDLNEGILPCGEVWKISGTASGTPPFLVGSTYEVRVYVWDGKSCPNTGWPDAYMRAQIRGGG